MTESAFASPARPATRVRAAVVGSAAVYGGLAVWFLVQPAPGLADPVRWSVFVASILLEGGLFAAAARRPDLGPRLRRALGISALAFGLTALSYLYYLAARPGWLPVIPDWADQVITFLTYAIAVGGVLCMPMVPADRGGWWRLGLDAAVAVGGLVLVFWMLVTAPAAAGVGPGDQLHWVFSYGAALVLDLIAINVLIVRGVAQPSRRALWCFVAALGLEIVSLVVFQYYEPVSTDYRRSDAVYLLVQMLYVWAGILFLQDPVEDQLPGRGLPRSLNPLPFVAIAGVSALLVREGLGSPAATFRLLVPGLVALVAVLALRLLVTVRENARLFRSEADSDRRRQAEKMDAIGRLAGGVAHEFNNLMTSVIGHAELALDTAPGDGGAIREDLTAIRQAALRAGRLTRELLVFSGRQFTGLRGRRLRNVVEEKAPALAASLPPGTELDTRHLEDVGVVAVDAEQLGHALHQIVTNGVQAVPSGGRLSILLEKAVLQKRLPTPFLAVPAGRYAVLAVQDTGMRIPADKVGSIFDPFYSCQPLHAAAGLGLAAVYGIVAAHQGGITVESTVGEGTTVRIFLPLVEG